jgi:hypothetical protein
MNMTHWLIGEFIAETEKGIVWEFVGVAKSRQDAIEHLLNDNYFIAPFVMGEFVHEHTTFPVIIYKSQL